MPQLLNFLKNVLLFTFLFHSTFSFANKTITDSVLKIKEDDGGKIILLVKEKEILYLPYDSKVFDSNLTKIQKCVDKKNKVKITVDGDLNILNIEDKQ